MENPLIIFNQVRREYTIKRFYFIHWILEIKSIPSVISKINFFSEKPVNYIGSIWIVKVYLFLFLFFVFNWYFATLQHEIFFSVLFYSTLSIFLNFDFHLLILRWQIDSKILETFGNSIAYVTIKGVFIYEMFRFYHLLFKCINELLNKVSFTHKVEMFHWLKVIFEVIPLLKFRNKFGA